ncbi:MAG: CHAT domain-containing protein [Acidobacteria bacterium]|nr:CHAT domain-containing protein [Acidobacteriota bacterium]
MRWVLPLVVATCSAIPAGGAIQATSFADCDRLVAGKPDDLESYRCYWMIARRTGQSLQALEALGSLAASRGADPRIDLYRAAILGDMGDPSAEDFARSATGGCEAMKEWTCATYGHLTLAWYERRSPENAHRELTAARRTALAANDPVLLVRVDLGLGWRFVAECELGAARAAFAHALRSLGPSGPFDARNSALSGLGYQAWATARWQESLDCYRRAAEEARRAPDLFLEARALYNALFVELELRRESDPGARPLLAGCEEALTAAERAGNVVAAGWVHLMIAAADVPPDRQLEELDRAIEMGRSTGSYDLVTTAWRMQANNLAARGRMEEAVAKATESLSLARSIRDPKQALWALELRAQLRFAHGDLQAARKDAAKVLEELDRLLATEPFARDRAGVEAHFANGPYTFAYALATAGEVDLALAISDHFRGRSVLAGLAPRPGPEAIDLEEVRHEISGMQRRLFLAGKASVRTVILEDLVELEHREEEILGRLQLPAGPVRPDPALAEIQAALDAQTAILSFQLAPGLGMDGDQTSSWVAAIDRSGARVLPLPPASQLAPAVRAFRGLLLRGDAPERSAASALGRRLLGDALAGLPEGITRLVIVPDAPLHELPFAALRLAPSLPPVGERYTFEQSESLAGWLARARRRSGRLPAQALVLADPRVATPAPDPGATLFSRSLGAPAAPELPGARREAAVLRRALGRGAVIETGANATESLVKEADLRRTGLLYFAAHAWVDADHPYRSALALAPGGGEDGLLQLRDVASLRLSGAIVVLAACNSAQGEVFAGEGVFSLARAFLDAGASAVVGNLGDIDDESAARVMEELIRGLARGRPLAEALARAKRRAVARGLPPAAWASSILIGDGTARLKGVQRHPLLWLALAAGVGAVALLFAWLTLRRPSRPS